MLRYPLLFLFLVALSANSLSAQADTEDCFFQLQLRDAEGDGFNGGAVIVTVAGVSRRYTLDATVDDGRGRDFFFGVRNGDEVTVGFEPGAFPEETSFRVLNNADSLLYEINAPDTIPELFPFTAQCRTCAPPPLSSIEVFRVRFNSVDIRFRGVNDAADPHYLIEYGTDDFDPETDEGSSLTTQDTMVRIGDLNSVTDYSFFVSTICEESGDTTVRRGPFRISTPTQTDVGITALRSPVDGCARGGTDSVTIGITNFGGAPQQFFEVDFTINGNASGVQTPFDGIYTGVVGVDSTEFFTFDTPAQLSEPGFYTFEIFTKLEGDQDASNDAFTTTVVRLPVIRSYPYAQDFEDGNGFWLDRQAGRGPSSWERARPRGRLIDRAGSGSFAYVTNADGNYNDLERSILNSPCFDFSGFDDDPFLSFSLFIDTEENFDQLFLEFSTDGGDTWETVERNPTGINWYNNGPDEAWDGDGGFSNGYALVSQQLRGLAGEADVQLRFVFESDDDTRREGVAIDNIRISEQGDVDLAAADLRFTDIDRCEGTDTVAFAFTDLGRQRVDSATVNYRVGNGGVSTLRVAAPTVLGQRRTVRIPVEISSAITTPSVEIAVWVEAEGDGQAANDTSRLVYELRREVPFLVDFDDGRRPSGYTLEGGFVLLSSAFGDNNTTLLTLLFEGDAPDSLVSPFYGPIEVGDSLSMDIFPESDATIDVRVLVEDGCQEIRDTLLDTELSDAGTLSFDLSAYVGGTVRFTVLFEYVDGDDAVGVFIDNIAIRRCPGDLDLRVTTSPPSGIFADDGTAFALVDEGVAPYTYQWSNGDTGASADSLSVEDYSVVVTDALGCTDTLDFSVDLTATGTNDPESLLAGLEVFPNPTTGWLRVSLHLNRRAPLSVAVYDATGREILRRGFGETDGIDTVIDLDARPAGMYLLRVVAGDASRSIMVVKR